MKSVIIKGVRCTIESKGKLCLELPAGMDGQKLLKWKDEHRNEAFELLEESDDKDEPVHYEQE